MIKNFPEAIIDLSKGMTFSNQKALIEVIVKKNGKTIYHNKVYAVVMNMVQSITTMTEEKGDVTLEGDSQVFGCGNSILQGIQTALHGYKRITPKSAAYIKAAEIIKAKTKANGANNQSELPVNMDNLKKLEDAFTVFQEAIVDVIIAEVNRRSEQKVK